MSCSFSAGEGVIYWVDMDTGSTLDTFVEFMCGSFLLWRFIGFSSFNSLQEKNQFDDRTGLFSEMGNAVHLLSGAIL
jgi:hypothetical protein